MPKRLGDVSIPNPYQKVKDKEELELQVIHRYIFNSITKKTLLNCFFSYLYHLI